MLTSSGGFRLKVSITAPVGVSRPSPLFIILIALMTPVWTSSETSSSSLSSVGTTNMIFRGSSSAEVREQEMCTSPILVSWSKDIRVWVSRGSMKRSSPDPTRG